MPFVEMSKLDSKSLSDLPCLTVGPRLYEFKLPLIRYHDVHP